MKTKETKLGVKFGQYTLIVTNAIKTYGHDDSLPYNADWQVKDGNNVILSGTAWNDGWGGVSCINSNNREIENLINGFMKEVFVYPPKGFNMEIKLGLSDVIDFLAIEWIGGVRGCFTEKEFINYLSN